MALRRPSGSREDVTTTAVVAEAVEARETRAAAEVLARVVGVAYYVVEDRVYPCYVFEAMGEESQAKLDNDLGKIKTELQNAARAVDASLVVSLEHMQQHLAAAAAADALAAAADALAASARAIAAFIKKNDATEQLGTVFEHGPVRHTERSIMFGVCSGQKSQPPFSASTGNYGVPAKESNVGNGQGDTIAPMRNMIPLAIETRAVEWLVVGFQFVAPKGVGRTRTLPEMTLWSAGQTRDQVYCPNKKQRRKGLSRK